MPLFKTTWDRDRDAAWEAFFTTADELRESGTPTRDFLSADEDRLLELPRASFPAEERLAHHDKTRGRLSQSTDLLVRLQGLEALLRRLPLEPPHEVPHAPHVERGTMIIRTDVVAPAPQHGTSHELLCRPPTPLPDELRTLLSEGRVEEIGKCVCRSALVYAALYSTIQSLTAVDQMRIPSVRATFGRSQRCDDTTVQLACWFRIGDNLRVLVSPKFTTMGDAIVAGCSHAILFVQPWMNQHPLESHSWWLSLAEHSYTHFHSPHGLYHRPGQVFTASKADGSRSWMYYGDHAGVLAAKSFLGPAGRILGARSGKTFYPSGPPEKRVAYSDSNQSFVSFVAGEWPFDAGSPAVVVINAFQSVLGHELSGLRARLQREVTSAP